MLDRLRRRPQWVHHGVAHCIGACLVRLTSIGRMWERRRRRLAWIYSVVERGSSSTWPLADRKSQGYQRERLDGKGRHHSVVSRVWSFIGSRTTMSRGGLWVETIREDRGGSHRAVRALLTVPSLSTGMMVVWLTRRSQVRILHRSFLHSTPF